MTAATHPAMRSDATRATGIGDEHEGACVNPFDQLFDLINTGVERFFSIDNIALWIASALLLWCAAIVAYNGRTRHRPFDRQLDLRLAATGIVGEAETDAEAQRLFADHFERIDGVMLSGEVGSLRHAWRQFKETILILDSSALRATTRPEGFFLHLGDETRVLAWWANIFVAIGLTFTFLGIVAALHKTVEIMSSGADQAGMLAALTGLLKITAAKFWTSIGGVGASIVLRMFDRRWHSTTLRKLEALCERLEYGMVYMPAQRLAAEQVERLEHLPARMAEAFGAELQPVVRELVGLRGSLEGVGRGGMAPAGDGTEMARLAIAVAAIAEQLEGVNGRLAHAGGQASREIASATRSLATVQGDIRAQAGEIGQALKQSANAAADRNAEILARSAHALEAATSRAAQDMGSAVDEAVRRSAEQSARVLSAAFAVFSDRFESGGSGLVDALAETSREVQGAATLLAQAARDAAGAAQPIREASAAIAEASQRTRDLLQTSDRRASEHERIMQDIAGRLDQTNAAAIRAWEEYRERFEEIDEALARALEQIATTSGEHATRINEHVGRIDGAFAGSVQQLAQAIAPLNTLARDLDALLARAQKAN